MEEQIETKTEDEIRKEEITVHEPELTLDIDDKELLQVIGSKIKASESYFKDKLKINKRRERNEKFWRGDHWKESEFEDWQIPYKDNLIWRNTEHRTAMASSRIPDLIITSNSDMPEDKEAARELENWLDIRLINEQTKRLTRNSLRDNHLKFIGITKFRYDPNLGEDGDFVYERVKPDYVILDHTATIPEDGFTADNMEFIAEWIEEPLSVVVSKFPDKKDELFKELGIVLGTTRQMASKIKYLEVWATHYDKEGKPQEIVFWKYGGLILGKSKTPYWEWREGDDVYKNFFDRPRKPYIFWSYQNSGNGPLDDTTAVEQAIELQRTINKRGRQITELSDKVIPKEVASGAAITKEQFERKSNDPEEGLWLNEAGVGDDIRKAFMVIPGVAPPSILFTDIEGNRREIDSLFSTHKTTRGDVESKSESGVARQITREGDLSISDDIVNLTVERAIYEIGSWAIQMMKIFYQKPHYVKKMGKDGELVAATMIQDKIKDGIAIGVKASTSDKREAKAEAMEMAARKAIDPLTMFEDMDVPNPKQKTKRLITFLTGEADMYARYLQEVGIEIGKESEESQSAASNDIKKLIAGEMPEPQTVDEAYVEVITKYINSPEFEQQPLSLIHI